MIGYQNAQIGNSNELENSLKMYSEASKVIPGGVSANIKFFSPHPIFMEKAKRSHLFDVDGNEYIDYLLCYGALILGHGHNDVRKAVLEQMMSTGTTVFGTPSKLETSMAEKIIAHFPSIDMVRFTNSGLEATLLSIRIAQAYTGKTKIAKFEGHYHGGYNEVLVSVNPGSQEAGDEKEPNPIPDSKGIPDHYLENTIILPFNEMDATEKILREHKDSLAAVILEPVQGGFIPAEHAFIHSLRKITEELGIVLIFDEVKTGYRVTVGGTQTIYDVTPDLTTLGKVVGGGFPIGAVGGKGELMEMMDPDKGRDILTAGSKHGEKGQALFHSGTYNGHPTVLAAGMATIKYLEKETVMSDLLKKTELLRTGLEKLYKSYGIPMQTLGMGSIFNIVLTNDPVRNYRDLAKADMELRKKIDYELLKLGVYTKPLNRYSLSVVHTKKDIAFTIDAHEKALQKVKAMGGLVH